VGHIRTAIFTICARNYLAYALTLGQSVRETSPDSDFYIFLADEKLGEEVPGVNIIDVRSLGLKDFASQTFRYTVMEFSTAIKPSCFKHLFEKLGYDAAIYLDPDIQLFAPLKAVKDAFGAGACFALTPHLLAPLEDGEIPSDIDILRSGTFNLGFAAARDCDEARRFLDWWEEMLRQYCYNDLQNGLFVDQKFAEFAPSFLPNLKTIYDPGYNVAYWNLLNRPVKRDADEWTAAGAPLTFFHFSGVVPGNGSIFSKHQSRFTMENCGEASVLVRHYLEKLEQNGHTKWSRISYGFGSFEDGTPIPDVVRRSPPLGEPPERWAKSYDAAYWNAPSDDVDQAGGAEISRLMFDIYQSRPDLQAEFPLSAAWGRHKFHDWFIVHGVTEYRLEEAHLRPAQGGRSRLRSKAKMLVARLRLRFS